METALFYYRYSDRNPAEWNFAIDKNVSKIAYQKLIIHLLRYTVLNLYWLLGEASGKIDSIDVRIYDRDRTICDVLRNMNKMDKEIFNKRQYRVCKRPEEKYS